MINFNGSLGHLLTPKIFVECSLQFFIKKNHYKPKLRDPVAPPPHTSAVISLAIRSQAMAHVDIETTLHDAHSHNRRASITAMSRADKLEDELADERADDGTNERAWGAETSFTHEDNRQICRGLNHYGSPVNGKGCPSQINSGLSARWFFDMFKHKSWHALAQHIEQNFTTTTAIPALQLLGYRGWYHRQSHTTYGCGFVMRGAIEIGPSWQEQQERSRMAHEELEQREREKERRYKLIEKCLRRWTAIRSAHTKPAFAKLFFHARAQKIREWVLQRKEHRRNKLIESEQGGRAKKKQRV